MSEMMMDPNTFISEPFRVQEVYAALSRHGECFCGPLEDVLRHVFRWSIEGRVLSIHIKGCQPRSLHSYSAEFNESQMIADAHRFMLRMFRTGQVTGWKIFKEL